MSKNTSTNLILASKDQNLAERATALAAEMGIENYHVFVGNQMLVFVMQEVTTDGDTVASVYDYAWAFYNANLEYAERARIEAIAAAEKAYQDALANLGPKPGANPSAVTDDHIRAALTKLQGDVTPPAQPTI